MARWLTQFGLRREDYGADRAALAAVFAAAWERGTAETGVFGLRLQRGSFDHFMEQAGLLYPGLTSDVARIEAAFGRTRFIHLTRPNKLDQAISRVKAEQTGLWHKAADGTDLERLAPPAEPVYEADRIARHLEELTALDEDWVAWFAREGITPLRVSYDDLSLSPTGELVRVLEDLGLDVALGEGVVPATAQLSDGVSRDWAARFRREQELARR